MNKIAIVSDGAVQDLAGLLEDLKERGFAVINVSADKAGTQVHMESSEEKDPTPVVLEWIGRPAKKLSFSGWKARVKETATGKKPLWERILRFFFRRRKRAILPPPTVPVPEETAPPEPPPKEVDPQFFRKIL